MIVRNSAIPVAESVNRRVTIVSTELSLISGWNESRTLSRNRFSVQVSALVSNHLTDGLMDDSNDLFANLGSQPAQRPARAADPIVGCTDGLGFFTSMVARRPQSPLPKVRNR